jgi:hypothetical protein
MTGRNLLATGLVGALALVTARSALAACPDPMTCDCTTLPSPVFVAGSSAVGPFIKAIGGPLSAAATPMTVIYQKQGSCVGVADIANDATPAGACTMGACITGTALYYDATGVQQSCNLPAGGQHVDVGVSDVYASSCTGITVPASVTDRLGPVQAMELVIPKASTETAITAEEAYFVFGFGGAMGMAAPWLDVTLQFIRNTGSGTQQMIARAIGVPANKMLGTDSGSSGGVATMVGGSTTNPNATIGILGADVYDVNRTTLSNLAFRAFGQWAAYYPDSTATAFDKRNVRDGHYVIWGNMHFLQNTTGGMPISANGKLLIDYIQGVAPGTQPFDIVQIETNAHVIPDCAMKVKRSGEVSNLSLYDPPAPCGCFFDSLVGTPSASCTACTMDAQCGAGKCRHGFCEAH